MTLQAGQAGSADARRIRLAIVASHPIQHFCPQYLSWTRLDGVDLRVFFASRQGLDTYHDDDFARSVRWEGLPLDFPHEFLPGAANRRVTATFDAPAVAERLAAFRPHVLCVYGYSRRLQRRAAAWGRRAGAAVLMVTDSELRSKRSWAKRMVKALVLPRLLASVDRFLTIGDANEAYLRRYGVADERFVRCPWPIDTASWDRALETRERAREAVRRRHGIPDNHHVVLMAGKLAPRKRQRDLVAFSNRVRGGRDDVTVVLAGSGAEERALRRLASTEGRGGVVFAGFVQPRTLADYYCAADAYVHCSESDPHPVAVSEAVYAGLPVVLSHRCGNHGPTDDVRPGLNGYVYPCGDVAALSSAFDRVFESPGRREAMARASLRIGRGNQRLAHGEALLQVFEGLRLPPAPARTREVVSTVVAGRPSRRSGLPGVDQQVEAETRSAEPHQQNPNGLRDSP